MHFIDPILLLLLLYLSDPDSDAISLEESLTVLGKKKVYIY
jgi:hypothetical protein